MESKMKIIYLCLISFLILFVIAMIFCGDENTQIEVEKYSDKFVKHVDRKADSNREVRDKDVLKKLMYSCKVLLNADKEFIKKIIVDEQSNFKDVDKVVPIYISEIEYNVLTSAFDQLNSQIRSSSRVNPSMEAYLYHAFVTTLFGSILYKYPMNRLPGYPSIAIEKNKKFLSNIISKSGSYLTKDHQKAITEKNISMIESDYKFSALDLVTFALITNFISDNSQTPND
jgi:hypothetical protein